MATFPPGASLRAPLLARSCTSTPFPLSSPIVAAMEAEISTNPWEHSHNPWEHSHNPWTAGAARPVLAMPDGEMKDLLRSSALPVRPGDLVVAQIRRAARALGLTDSRAREIWYGRASRILAEELDRARAWRLRHLAASRARLLEEMRRMDAEERRLDRLLRSLTHDDDAP